MEETKNKKKAVRGLVLVNTGNGKGKTTAALGVALRASGHGMKVLILQFIKGVWMTGEEKAIKKFIPNIEIEKLGKGFIEFRDGKPVITEEQLDLAAGAFRHAVQKVNSGDYDVVILDEINNLISYGLLKAGDLVKLVKNKPEKVNLVITGRGAPQELIDIADIVSEIKEIKHAFGEGIKARKGIEF